MRYTCATQDRRGNQISVYLHWVVISDSYTELGRNVVHEIYLRFMQNLAVSIKRIVSSTFYESKRLRGLQDESKLKKQVISFSRQYFIEIS